MAWVKGTQFPLFLMTPFYKGRYNSLPRLFFEAVAPSPYHSPLTLAPKSTLSAFNKTVVATVLNPPLLLPSFDSVKGNYIS